MLFFRHPVGEGRSEDDDRRDRAFLQRCRRHHVVAVERGRRASKVDPRAAHLGRRRQVERRQEQKPKVRIETELLGSQSKKISADSCCLRNWSRERFHLNKEQAGTFLSVLMPSVVQTL